MFGHDEAIAIGTTSRKIYEGVMKRCGEFLTRLDDNRERSEILILQLAAKHCHNIKYLDVMISSKADDKHMNQLLAVNQQLRALHFQIKFKNAKMCLRSIATDHLEELLIGSEQNLFPPSILMSQKQIVRKTHSLKRLNSYFVDEELIELIGRKVELEGLVMAYCGNSLKKDTWHPVLNLKNLRELAICASWTSRLPQPLASTDDFLVTLTDNLRLLETLKLDVSPITDRGFVHLASLPKLGQLSVVGSQGVTDKFLHLFAGLEMLVLGMCNIRDEGVIKLLEKTQTMRELNVAHTLITDKTLIAAIKATKKRINGVCLTLHVPYTNATPETITEYSPLLEIVY